MKSMLLLAALAASPQAKEVPGGALVDAFRKCTAITANDARLACLDAASAALIRAADQRQVTVIDQDTVRHVRRARFGLPNAAAVPLGLRNVDAGQPELKEMKGRIRTISEVAPDRYQIELEGGALWKNIEPFRRLPRPGDDVTIVKAAMNSFFFNIGKSRTGTRCVRVR